MPKTTRFLLADTRLLTGPQQSLKGVVRDKLFQAGLKNKLKTDIRLNVPLFKRDVEIPIGYQNGKFNLLTPVSFGAQDPDQLLEKACKYAVEGKSLNETMDPQLGALRFCVIGHFRPNDVDTKAVVSNVLAEHEVKLYRMDQLSTLIDEIRRTGKDLT